MTLKGFTSLSTPATCTIRWRKWSITCNSTVTMRPKRDNTCDQKPKSHLVNKSSEKLEFVGKNGSLDWGPTCNYLKGPSEINILCFLSIYSKQKQKSSLLKLQHIEMKQSKPSMLCCSNANTNNCSLATKEMVQFPGYIQNQEERDKE